MNVNLVSRQDFEQHDWENLAFNSLREKSRYLIETRGFEEFHWS
jgi:hypothetical protein